MKNLHETDISGKNDEKTCFLSINGKHLTTETKFQVFGSIIEYDLFNCIILMKKKTDRN